jgi:DNA-binding MarR family transcriptional regulator
MSKDNRPAQPRARRREISAADYRKLAEFRFRIRRFLHFTEEAARAHGMEPQQHQLLLAIRGLPKGARPTVTTISDRLCLRHHSTVELIDRLEKQGAVARQHGKEDRREVLLHLTPRGEDRLRRLTVSIWPQLQVEGVALSGSLQELLGASREPGRDTR